MTNVPRAFLALVLLLLATDAAAQPRRLTVKDIYDPDKKHEVGGVPPVTPGWIDDRYFHWPRPGERRGTTEHLKVEALTGRAEPLFDAGRLRGELERVAGLSGDLARPLAEQSTYVMDDRRTALVVSAAGDLHLFEFASGTLRRLTHGAGPEEEPAFSPDGGQIAFVRGGNLHVVARDGTDERALTTDGGPDVLNGKLDWIYQEEIYGRGKFKGYWWSPDSKSLAFLQLHEARVPTFPVVDDIPYQPLLELERYPKAGDPNPDVRLGVVAAAAGPPRWVDLARWSGDEPLVVGVGWTPDARRVVFQVQNRIQTWLDLVFAERGSLEPRVLFRETTRAWVEPQENGLQFLKDGTFLWLSERTGWKHVYRYQADGTLVGPVTRGEWEARTLHGADPARGWVYFTGTERAPIGEDVYRIRLDGTGLERLSRREGHHAALFNPSFGLYLDTWSDVLTPPQVRLHGPDGAEVRAIDAKALPALGHFGLVKPEFLEVPTRDGFVMEAMLLKPPDFDPSRRYPVYQHVYGGPHAPQVKNKWDSNTSLFHQMLAQRGIVVWICDNRSASGKGAVSAWTSYKNFGELELKDVEDGLDWLTKHPWVDASRIGINGWSFGGYMVSYALTHSRRFAMGIAGAPVTDWRDYDSVYTERVMDLPGSNPEGYRRSAPRAAAAKLSGRLLLIHGIYDDNVHPQNTNQFAYELQKAGRPFRLMTYARQRHTFTDTDLIQHLRSLMLAWIEETLLGAPAHAWPLDHPARRNESAAPVESGGIRPPQNPPAVTSPSSGTGSGRRSPGTRPAS